MFKGVGPFAVCHSRVCLIPKIVNFPYPTYLPSPSPLAGHLLENVSTNLILSSLNELASVLINI